MKREKCIEMIEVIMKKVDPMYREDLVKVLEELKSPVVIDHAVVHQDGGALQGVYTPGGVIIEKLTCIDDDDRWDDKRHERYEQTMEEVTKKGFVFFTETFDED